MIIIGLFLLGLCLGSFVNALVWRLREQGREQGAESKASLSVLKGRSMCPNCRHELAAKDLVPVLSWLALRGKCRYCGAPISGQYPLVELLTAALFALSYAFWPLDFGSSLFVHGSVLFVFWLIFLVGLVALAVYDLRWMLLPDKITYPLLGLAFVQTVLLVLVWDHNAWDILLSMIIGGGLFYMLFQISGGRWIGGGDVKLGALVGLILASPPLSLLMIFTASLLGSLISVPLLLAGRAKRNTKLPFGPFLIAACMIVYLFGASFIDWYKRKFLLY